MTEEKFEEIMENVGETIEKTVEGAADEFDRSMNKAWRRRSVRLVAKTLSFIIGAGLIASAIPLSENGTPTLAVVSFISGVLVIVSGIVEILIFRRK